MYAWALTPAASEHARKTWAWYVRYGLWDVPRAVCLVRCDRVGRQVGDGTEVCLRCCGARAV